MGAIDGADKNTGGRNCMLTICQHTRFAPSSANNLANGSAIRWGKTMPDYLGFRDLLARWVYTRQGIYKVLRYPDFPAVVFTINQGRTKVWAAGEIAAFEKRHPELLSIERRDWKMQGYHRARLRDRQHAKP